MWASENGRRAWLATRLTYRFGYVEAKKIVRGILRISIAAATQAFATVSVAAVTCKLITLATDRQRETERERERQLDRQLYSQFRCKIT